MSLDFNQESEKPRFIYKRNPLVEHSYQIFGIEDGKSKYEPVGEYTVLDTSEDPELTDKKVSNIVRTMNEREGLMDLSFMTDTRLLFQPVADNPASANHKLIFRTYDGDGISKDNAILSVRKGVLDEGFVQRGE